MPLRSRRSWQGLLLATCLACAGCRGNPLYPGRELAGTWAEQSSFPGSSFVFTLSQLGDSLWGTGSYSGEAGPQGTLAVSGHIQASPGDTVTLRFTFTQTLPTTGPTGTEDFVGRLASASALKGLLSMPRSSDTLTVERTFIRSP